jgi:ribonuclease BN (tRNA processing enzyme)
MKLTVLGKYGPWPKAGGACSSYLISSGDANILLDAGNGSFSNLQKRMDYHKLDAIVLSHLHSDHISDLLVMRYALQNTNSPAIPIYLPESPENMYEIFKEETAYDTTVLSGQTRFAIRGTTVTFKKMTHSVDSFAIKVQSEKSVFVYSGDTYYNDDLAGFAKNADMLLCDAAFSNETLPEKAPHLSSAQAAAIARDAGVKKLYLTHISPLQDEDILLREAKEIFENSEITVENKTVVV